MDKNKQDPKKNNQAPQKNNQQKPGQPASNKNPQKKSG
jgi:hypothetical protein